MKTLYEFTIPIRTKNPMNNSQGVTRAGMFARASERRQQRYLSALVLSPARRKVLDLIRQYGFVCVKLTRIAPSSGLDSDALPASMKSVRDGIADALELKSDRVPEVKWLYDQQRGKDYAVRAEIGVDDD